ncbi:phosphatidylethanolamine-binding protein [Hypoxylon sp. NC0597]|nr:phosphatidylethanolamine-binding protein [Hypoxylon sp. NC0597]
MGSYLTLFSLVWCSVVVPILGQTFPGFKPETSNPLAVAWGETPLNYSGQPVSLDFLNSNKSLPTLGLPTTAQCNGTYILLMVDPDALQGDIETQAGLHTIQGNLTCDSQHVTTVGNTTFLPLETDSEPLAPFIPPTPQPKNPVVTHRYTFLLFNQPVDYTLPDHLTYALPLDLSNVTNRLNFNIPDFAESVGNSIVAGTYFNVDSPPADSGTSSSSPTPSSTGTGEASSSPTSPSAASRFGGLSAIGVSIVLTQCILALTCQLL